MRMPLARRSAAAGCDIADRRDGRRRSSFRFHLNGVKTARAPMAQSSPPAHGNLGQRAPGDFVFHRRHARHRSEDQPARAG